MFPEASHSSTSALCLLASGGSPVSGYRVECFGFEKRLTDDASAKLPLSESFQEAQRLKVEGWKVPMTVVFKQQIQILA